MRKSIYCLSILLSSVLLLNAACESNKNLEKEALTIQQQLDSAWVVMTNSDDSKIANLQMMIQEFKLINGIDSSRIPEFEAKLNDLKNMRYTQESMNESVSIDKYDESTDQLWSSVKNFVQANGEIEKYQVMNQLVEEIGMADDSVIIYRQGYDKVLDKYNAFVAKHEKHLSSLPAPINSWKPRNYFRIAQ